MEKGPSLDVEDTAGLENAAELALTAFCWWRTDIPQEVCEDYWRDVHGIMFTRVPGLWQYRAPYTTVVWAALPCDSAR